MEEEQRILTKEQALLLLPNEDYIHTFVNIGPVLVGADWSRKEVEEEIEQGECQVGGEACRALEHGLVIIKNGRPLFVNAKEGVLEELEKSWEEA